MNMVYHRKKTERTAFRKVGFGQRFMAQLGTVAYGPVTKLGRRRYYEHWHGPDQPNAIAVVNTAAEVTKVPTVFKEYEGEPYLP